MGLDWHSCIFVEKGGQRVAEKPCSIVGATKMKDRPTFRQDVEKYLAEMKRRAEEEKEKKTPNKDFIEYWRKRTLEEELVAKADKWDCDSCPFLKELAGADSAKSLFLGITVTSCDFRGKVIGNDGAISPKLSLAAYKDERTPPEMNAYADELERELERLRAEGYLTKDPYEKYSQVWDEQPEVLKRLNGPKMTREEYEKSMHWRERNIRNAIHWLRTCAKYGVSMTISY